MQARAKNETMNSKEIGFITSPISSINVTFPQLPGVNVWFVEISDPASIKLLIRLRLRMRITSGGHRCCKTQGGLCLICLNSVIALIQYNRNNKGISALPKTTGVSEKGATQESDQIKKTLPHTVQRSAFVIRKCCSIKTEES